MKLEDIETVEQAKALAFDAIQRIEIEQQNLRALQQRIVELSEGKTDGQIVNDATATVQEDVSVDDQQ